MIRWVVRVRKETELLILMIDFLILSITIGISFRVVGEEHHFEALFGITLNSRGIGPVSSPHVIVRLQ